MARARIAALLGVLALVAGAEGVSRGWQWPASSFPSIPAWARPSRLSSLQPAAKDCKTIFNVRHARARSGAQRAGVRARCYELP
jgi:hypothetical protein